MISKPFRSIILAGSVATGIHAFSISQDQSKLLTSKSILYQPPSLNIRLSTALSSKFVAWNDEASSTKPDSPKRPVESLHNHIEDIHLEEYRPDPEKYERIDHFIFKSEIYRADDPKGPLHSHVLYSSLLGESKVECYEIYKPKKVKDDAQKEEIVAIIAFGDKLNGWPDIVHGGK
jgi:hypothetical protein